MTILTFPSSLRLPSAATLRLRAMTQSHESPFDGSVQTLALPGQRWQGTLTWAPMPVAEWRTLAAFVAKLGGRAGRFSYTHPMTWRRATTTYGTPLVNGGSQTGAALITDGWTNSTTVMLAGDYLAFQDTASRWRMHVVTADVTSNGSGQATIAIAPPLRSSPANNAAIDIETPKATWMLASDDAGDFATAPAARATVALDIIEALV